MNLRCRRGPSRSFPSCRRPLRRAILHLLLLRGEFLLGDFCFSVVACANAGVSGAVSARCHRRRQDMLEHGELLHWDGRPRCTLLRFERLDLRRTSLRSFLDGGSAAWPGASAAASEADRSLLLADAERLEDIDHAGRMRPAVQRDPGEHRARRSVQAGFPENLAEQPDAGDRRSRRTWRAAALGLRVRRNSTISRPQDREILSGGRARACRGGRVVVLADGQSRTQGRRGQPLPPLCAGKAALRA